MIKIDGLTCGYDKTILKDIDLRIQEGKITFIVGKNGSGKSTFAHILTGLNTKFKGNVSIDEVLITKKTPMSDIRRKIGLVFQNPSSQIIFTSVHDDLKFTLENLKFPKEEIVNRISEALKQVDMIKEEYCNPYELSGGQKQKIAIASVLVTHPRYIVFDEATSMLDITSKKEIYKLFKQLKRDKIGCIIITNNMDELIYADEIIILNNSKAFCYNKKDLFDNVNILKQHHLDVPFLLKTIQHLRNKGIQAINENDILKAIEKL